MTSLTRYMRASLTGLAMLLAAAPVAGRAAPPARLLIDGVTVVDTRTGALAPKMAILIQDGFIVDIAPSGTLKTEAGIRTIDATGKFVVPGFNDMHAHILGPADPSKALALMLANGVTGFSQLSGSPELLAQRRAGTLPIGPDAPALLAMPGTILTPFNALDADDAVATIREQQRQGADFIKVALVTPAVFVAVQAEARRLHIPLVGHLPDGVDVRVASRSGMHSIEHLGPGEGINSACSTDEQALRAELLRTPRFRVPPFKIPFLETLLAGKLRKVIINPKATQSDEDFALLGRALSTYSADKCRALAAQLIADGTWQTPTLIRERSTEMADAPEFAADPNLRYMSEATLKTWRESMVTFNAMPAPGRALFRQSYAQHLKLVKLFDEAGAKMMAGSDVSGIWEVPGFSLHQEFDQLALAGLSPLHVLQMTTLNGAQFLGRTASMGSVERNKAADLVLLDANPVDSVRNLHGIHAVVRAGRYYAREDLERLKAAVLAGRGVTL